jgi:hypothetical protein
MRRIIGIGVAVAVLVVLAGIGIGVGAYNAGLSEGISQGLARSGESVEVVRVVGRGYGPGFGFFPFGFLLFPLFLIGIFLLLRAAFWRGRWGGYGPRGWGGPGPWDPRAQWGPGPWQGEPRWQQPDDPERQREPDDPERQRRPDQASGARTGRGDEPVEL